MTEKYTDAEVRNVQPERLLDVLNQFGWTELEVIGNHARIYRSPSGEDVMVPTRQDYRDYPRAARDVIYCIAEESATMPDTVYNSVRYPRYDVTRLGTDTGTGHFMIGMDAMANLVGAVRTLVHDAAKSALRVHSDRQHYLANAKFGPSEHGSYVVTVFGPQFRLEEQFSMFETPPPTRRVTNALHRAIDSTRTAVSQLKNGNDKAFDNAQESGITTKTCEGLFAAVAPFESINCRITHATLHLSPSPAPLNVTFTHEDARFLKEAADELRRNELQEDVERRVIGYIRTFDRGEQDEEGKATMKALLDDSRPKQTIHMMLDAEQYALANDLHIKRTEVEARGALKQSTKNTWWLENPVIREVPQ